MNTQVSIFTWLAQQVHSYHTQQLAVFIVVGFLGVVAHYIKKYMLNEVSGSLWNYLALDNPKFTLLTLGTFLTSCFSYVYSGTLDTASWPTLIGLALSTGFSFDSAINKSTPKSIKINTEKV